MYSGPWYQDGKNQAASKIERIKLVVLFSSQEGTLHGLVVISPERNFGVQTNFRYSDGSIGAIFMGMVVS